jgi:hypothetical protein
VKRAAVKLSESPLERGLQVSGMLLILGLLTETVCLFWARPLSFLAFISVGGALLLLGILLYLLSVLAIRHPRP